MTALLAAPAAPERDLLTRNQIIVVIAANIVAALVMVSALAGSSRERAQEYRQSLQEATQPVVVLTVPAPPVPRPTPERKRQGSGQGAAGSVPDGTAYAPLTPAPQTPSSDARAEGGDPATRRPTQAGSPPPIVTVPTATFTAPTVTAEAPTVDVELPTLPTLPTVAEVECVLNPSSCDP